MVSGTVARRPAASVSSAGSVVQRSVRMPWTTPDVTSTRPALTVRRVRSMVILQYPRDSLRSSRGLGRVLVALAIHLDRHAVDHGAEHADAERRELLAGRVNVVDLAD